ncbi:hypothetical protein ACPV5L_07565 [Vibrio astriarenae]|uniref:DUF1778 domain-containing protein n=1 Tax=Vibrio agarivorans TaxID=153622 RepID=A0ABT7XW66_9VIBR|nr:hypothetical protein [Vibrio agarivorans]MDN2480016.1 hypothetical protein [Vibrio agarivorans]
MNKKPLTAQEQLKAMTTCNPQSHIVNGTNIEEWIKMHENAESIELNQVDYEQFVTYLSSPPDRTVVKELKKRFEQKAPWE